MTFDLGIKRAIAEAFKEALAKKAPPPAPAVPKSAPIVKAPETHDKSARPKPKTIAEAPPEAAAPAEPAKPEPPPPPPPPPPSAAAATIDDVASAIRDDIEKLVAKGALPDGAFDVTVDAARKKPRVDVAYSSLLDLFVPSNLRDKALPTAVRKQQMGYTQLTLEELLKSHRARKGNPAFDTNVTSLERYATRETLDELDFVERAVRPKFRSLGDAAARFRSQISAYLASASE